MTECRHIEEIRDVVPRTRGCEECLKSRGWWVHLRLCLTCDVGCCDSSPNKHATKHFHRTSHPAIRSFDPGELWGWCYVDQVTLDLSLIRRALWIDGRFPLIDGVSEARRAEAHAARKHSHGSGTAYHPRKERFVWQSRK
jgi:Zn-finger in ubiquitin-hydrolases and other protein